MSFYNFFYQLLNLSIFFNIFSMFAMKGRFWSSFSLEYSSLINATLLQASFKKQLSFCENGSFAICSN